MPRNQLIIDSIIIGTVLIFLKFFSLTLIDETSKFNSIGILGLGVLLAIITFYSLTFKNNLNENRLDKYVLFLILSMIISMIMADLFWDQTFIDSFKEYKYFYIFFLYFIPNFFKIESDRLQKIIVIMFGLSVIVFLIDYITFPDPLFSYRTEERREGMTIFFFGQGFTFLGGFYFLNKYITERKLMYLLLFGVAGGCLFLLTQSRMNLLALSLGLFLILLTSNFKKKYFIAAALFVLGIITYTSTDILSGIKEASQDQTKNYKEDIRVQAHNYFLTQFQGGTPTIILGNGFPSADSKLGLESLRGNLLGYWTADVGLTGIFSYFGIFGVLIWLLLFYYVFKIKVSENSIYIKAYFLALLSTAFTGYSIFDPGYMPSTVLALSLMRFES